MQSVIIPKTQSANTAISSAVTVDIYAALIKHIKIAYEASIIKANFIKRFNIFFVMINVFMILPFRII